MSRRAVSLGFSLGVALWCAPALAAQAPHNGSHETAAQVSPNAPKVKPHDDLQPDTLPTMPHGMTPEMLVAGDSIFHGQGRCFACHGQEAEGLPAAGDALTMGLNFAQYQWQAIDSLIANGMPQELTRSPIAMPPRGGKSDLSDQQVSLVAAYVWAISQTRGEPWPGGHQSHDPPVPNGPAAAHAKAKPPHAAAHVP
jgi:cytochrome c5